MTFYVGITCGELIENVFCNYLKCFVIVEPVLHLRPLLGGIHTTAI